MYTPIFLDDRFLTEKIDGKKLVDLHERIKREPAEVKSLLKSTYGFSADAVQRLCDALENIHYYWERRKMLLDAAKKNTMPEPPKKE